MTDSSAIMINYAHEVSTGNFNTGDICRNCFDYVQTAECYENTRGFEQKYFDKIDKVLEDYAIFLGHLHGNEYDNRCWHNNRELDADNLCKDSECCQEPNSFYNYLYSGCFMCDERMGGDYYEITAVKRDTVGV